MYINRTSGAIVDSAITIHRRVGPGLLEGAYERFLAFELRRRGHLVRTQVPQSINHDGFILDGCYRLDLLVDEQVVVELKRVEKLLPVHEAQLLSYLVLGDYRLGLLINFKETRLKDGIRRLVNRFEA